VADWTYGPNREGLGLLTEQILPRVWEQLPDARLRLVGRGLERERFGDARVDVLGFVDDLTMAYDGADVVAVPLVTGGGTSLKFVEALAYGVPVVATPVGARGLRLTPGEHYVEAAAPAAFADALVHVLRDGDGGMAARGRAIAERDFSVATLARLLDPATPPERTTR
jgi:glycosyltransferase involved in cell wall biosynthesis